ncbi:AAA domain-containing protein [bacterium]|nr:AAA domain-containing protein [bacterium]MCI0691228.1 AAA domain-containing protein [candidate division KSB1 bacterium]
MTTISNSDYRKNLLTVKMPSEIIQEFIQTLDEEIDANKRGKGGSTVKIFNGHFLREISGLHLYVFNLENFLAVLDESPAEIEIREKRYPAQVLSTQGLEVEIGIENFCGKFIPEAKLQTNLWYLLELLKKKFTECQKGLVKVDFRLSEFLFLNRPLDSIPELGIAECTNCKTQNRIRAHPPNARPICTRCKTPLVLVRFSSNDSSNDAQKKAIEASFSSQLTVIWGPPGTGKTQTIAQAIEGHLKAGRRVLLVSHANNAVDQALEKVAKQLKNTVFYREGKLVRLGKPQEAYLKKFESDYELVLIEKIAAKLGDALIREKNALVKEKTYLDNLTTQFDTAFRAIETVGILTSELNKLRSQESESASKLRTLHSDLQTLEELQKEYKKKLLEAQSAGTLKRIFMALDPQRIEHEIDQANVKIDFTKLTAKETSAHLNELRNLCNRKEAETNRARNDANTILWRLGVSEGDLKSKKRTVDQRKDVILARFAEIDQQLDELQKKILSDAKLIATTLTKTFVTKQFPDTPFDVLILDEASMAPLPHLYWAASRCRAFITIVGDFLQLPPICIAEKTMAQKWLGRSIFEILGIKSVNDACNDPRVKLLDTQYRMAPQISVIPNRFFYQNKLKDDPSTLNGKFGDGISESPLVLIETAEINPWCSKLSTGGRFNLYNALVSATLAKRIIVKIEIIRKARNNSNAKIGIVTPYAAQARLINKIAADWKLLDYVRISTVHKFQGGEEPIIIFDTVEGLGIKTAPMLDDMRDAKARLLLNVAITRAERRLYLVGHTRHLLSDLQRDSALARIVHYFNENAEVLKSGSLVDNYFTTDFEKWADALLSTPPVFRKPVSGELYTERNFWGQFFQDIKTIKGRFILLSPFISLRRSSILMNNFKAMAGRGIEIRIYTRPKNQQTGQMAEQAEIVIEQLRSIGAKVFERRSMHQKVAILDNAIAWEGSLNILSHRDTQEHMRRFEGPSAIEEIIRNLELDEDMPVGNQTEEKCPEPDCNGFLVIRTKYGRKFFGCSNYATKKCRYTRPLGRK